MLNKDDHPDYLSGRPTGLTICVSHVAHVRRLMVGDLV